MYHQARGIVLHTIKYSETSVIAKIYTDKFGLLSFIIKGVRSAKSKSKASLLQPLTMLDMELNYRENRNLQFVKEFSRGYNYQVLPFDTLRSVLALFIIEVVHKTVREQEPNEELFDFIASVLLYLDNSKSLMPDFHLLFLMHFSRHLGFAPNDNYTSSSEYFDLQEGAFVSIETHSPYCLNEKESEYWRLLMNASLFGKQPVLQLRKERQQMLRQLIRYYRLHIENFQLNSPEILETVLHG